MINFAMDASRRMWLDPDAGLRAGGKRKAGCLCSICGERYPRTEMYDLAFSSVCTDCADERTYTYDVYPEYEEESYICCECGELCEGSVTLIEKEAYCKMCLEERKMA